MAFWNKTKSQDNKRINIDEYFIEWTKTDSEITIYDNAIIKVINEAYENMLIELYSIQRSEFINKQFSKLIKIMDIKESFITVPGISHFLNIKEELYKMYSPLLSELTLIALKKYGYHCAKKFYEIVESKFEEFDTNVRMIQRYIEIITTELINGYESIIKKSTVYSNESINETVINEFLDLGLNDSFYFSRILKESTELTLSMIGYKEQYGTEHTFVQTIGMDQTFDDIDEFVEKTQTLYMNNSIESAFKIFGLNADSNPTELKQAYRKLAKQYHPDVNKQPDAHVVMQNINIHKAILDEYFED
ncbi:J domain-containing protein [Spiroplasma endosymbiont of Othius punctulatus]|uniref:J domain-containing protein n=1 Tax=Spiroplasma endosymbiont of Othius punctulatus TaxID=3066289 RepID=UPI0030CE45BE